MGILLDYKFIFFRNKQLVVDLLEGISKVKRFNINIKSMISKEKKGIIVIFVLEIN